MEELLIWIFAITAGVSLLRNSRRLKKAEKRIEVLENESAARGMAASQMSADSVAVAEDNTDVLQTDDPEQQAQPAAAASVTVKAERTKEVIKPKKIKEPKPVPAWRKDLFTVESIISKLGILLLLIGVGFIFKLAYDNGYITEEIAVLFGAVIGGILIYLGSRVERKNRHVLSQVLFGGGVATFYITVYAAYQGYGLIGGIVAFIFMCAVTALGFVLSLITDSVAMSVIAIMGGLLTPFVLQLEQLGLFGTGIYIFMIAIAVTAVYIFKRWRILQMSGIIGVYIVTGYFVSLTGFSDTERLQLALLMIAVGVIFTGTEYVLALIGKASSRYPGLTYGILCVLPLATLLETAMILDISDRAWSIALAIVAAVYIMVAYALHRKGTEPVVVNITLALTATFLLFSILIYYGEDIRAVAILMLAIIYYLLHKRLGEGFQVYVGHVLMLIGFGFSIDHLFSEPGFEAGIVSFLVRTLLVVLMVAAAMINEKKLPRYIIGIFALGYFLPIVLQEQIYQLSETWEPLAVGVVVHGIYIGLLYGLNRWLKVIPNTAIVVLGLLLFLVKILASGIAVFESEMNGYDVVVFTLYSVLLYVLAQFQAETWGYYRRMSLKTMVYVTLFVLLITDISVGMDAFIFGLLPVGVMTLAIQFFEPDRDEKWMINLVKVFKLIWFVMILFYMGITLFDAFGAIWLVMDLLLIVLIALNLKYLEMNLPLEVSVCIHGLLYAVLVYKNFQDLQFGNGIITLLWAAYAIGLLVYSVMKTHTTLVRISIGFICGIAVKFVLIDLASVSTLWKIIVSMVFGSALLGLSYFLQPVLAGNRVRQK